jgi:hypothetical protein
MAVLKFLINNVHDRLMLKSKYGVADDISASKECMIEADVIDNTKDLKTITLNGTKWTMMLPYNVENSYSSEKRNIWSSFVGNKEDEYTVASFSSGAFYLVDADIGFKAMYTLRFETREWKARDFLEQNYNATDLSDDDVSYFAKFNVSPDVGGCKAVTVNGITFITDDYASLDSSKQSTWAKMEAGLPADVEDCYAKQFSARVGFESGASVVFYKISNEDAVAMRVAAARVTVGQALSQLPPI